MKRSSSIIKNMPVSSDEVRAASAVDEVTTMNFVPTNAIGAESVAVQSKAKKIVDIFELSDSDDEWRFIRLEPRYSVMFGRIKLIHM